MARVKQHSGGKNLIRQPTFQVGKDVKINAATEIKILEYLEERLVFAKPTRDNNVQRYMSIDKEVAGFIKLDDDDLKREQDKERGKGPKPVDVVLPFTLVQLDEAITYLLSVMAPEEAIYTAQASVDKQDIAKGFAVLMNQHADDFQHYRSLARGFFDMLKYNVGGFMPEWEQRRGTRIEVNSTETDRTIVPNQVVAEGNSIEPFDPYNTLLDPSVAPVDVAAKGEFFVTVDVHTKFKLKRMEAANEIYNLKNALEKYATNEHSWYEKRPDIRTNKKGGNNTSWVEVLSQGATREVTGAHELLTFTIWINPKELGIDSKVNEYRIYRINTLGTKAVVEIQELKNAHGLLPINVGVPWEDGFESQTKSNAELLLSTQRFSSFQLNIHQRAARKALYGLTLYDKLVFPDMENADPEGGRVAASPSGQDRDLRKSVLQLRDVPDTSNTMADIEAMEGIAQKILPTDILKQVSSLERATQYQAAATVQGANRRNLKMAKLINIQCMTPCRTMQMMNIFQFQDEIELLDPQGNPVTVKPLQFLDAKLRFVVSDGLKGLDKLLIIESIKEVISWLLQSQQAAAEYDIAAIIDYWTSMLGDYTDFKQFKFENQFDKLTPEQKDQAFQLLQQVAAEQTADEEGNQPVAAGGALTAVN